MNGGELRVRVRSTVPFSEPLWSFLLPSQSVLGDPIGLFGFKSGWEEEAQVTPAQ